MGALRRGSRLLLLVLVGMFVTSCGSAAPAPDVYCEAGSPGYCASLQMGGAGLVEAQSPIVWPSHRLASGAAVELTESQADWALASGAATQWRPDFQTTAVIMVDRSRTDELITGWQDLLSAEGTVGFDHRNPSNWLLLAAAAWGLEDDLEPGNTTFGLLADVRRQGRLTASPDEAAFWIGFEHQAVDRIASGQPIEVVYPADGTLTFIKGLAVDGELLPTPELGEALAAAGYSAVADPLPAPARLVRPGDLAHSPIWKARYYRQVLGEHYLYFVGTREHTIGPALGIVALIAWIGSFARRGSQPSVRRAAFAVGVLGVVWLGMRMVKILSPAWLSELLWYGFYLPMLMLPLCLLWLAWAVDRPIDPGRPPPWWGALIGVNATLLLLVLTNGYHELVFAIERDELGDMTSYSYEPGYFVVAAAAGIPLIWAVGWLAVKSRRVPGRRLPWLPELIVAALAAYLVVYALGVTPLAQTDLTLAIIFTGLLLIEAAVRTGKLPLNRRYGQFFRASSLKMRIVDEGTGGAITAGGTVGDRPSATEVERRAPIRGGQVSWIEDVSAIAALQRHTSVAIGRLQTLNAMLASQRIQQRSAIASQVRAELLQTMETEVGARVNELGEIIGALPPGPVDGRSLARIALRACFIKRRAALFFQLQSGESLGADTMDQHFTELAGLAEPAGVRLMVRCPLDSLVPVHYPELLYECVFALVDHAVVAGGRAVVGQVSLSGPQQRLSVLLPAEFEGFTMPRDLSHRLEVLGAEVGFRRLDESFTFSVSVPEPETADV